MAYYGGYGSYPGQFMSYGGPVADPSGYGSMMQASYGYGSGMAAAPASIVQTAPVAASVSTSGAAQPRVASAAPNYYATGSGGGGGGPSYSTASDNDYNSLPVIGGGNNNVNTSGYYNNNMGSYATGYVSNGGMMGYPAAADQNTMASFGMSSGYPMMSDPYAQYAYANQQYNRPQASYSAPPVASYSQNGAATLTQQQNRSSSSPSHHTVVGDEFSQLAPQIEAAYEAATHHRRQPVIKRQVITVPGTPGKVQQVVRRLPTPTPDIVERVFIVKPQRDVVNLVIERPGTPPAQYKDRTVMGKQRRPLINPRIIRVAPRQTFSTAFYQQYGGQLQPQVLQYQQSAYQQQQPQYNPFYFQQQQQQQYLHALPGPTSLVNQQANTLQRGVPPSASATYQNYPQQSQTPTPVAQQQQQQQPSNVSQYEPQLSQGHLSQAQLSSQQHSQSQVLQQQQPQPQSQSQVIQGSSQSAVMVGPKGFLIAPIQYDDFGSVSQGGFASSQAAGLLSSVYSQGYGNGYSTSFPVQQGFFNSSAYPLYGR